MQHNSIVLQESVNFFPSPFTPQHNNLKLLLSFCQFPCSQHWWKICFSHPSLFPHLSIKSQGMFWCCLSCPKTLQALDWVKTKSRIGEDFLQGALDSSQAPSHCSCRRSSKARVWVALSYLQAQNRAMSRSTDIFKVGAIIGLDNIHGVRVHCVITSGPCPCRFGWKFDKPLWIVCHGSVRLPETELSESWPTCKRETPTECHLWASFGIFFKKVLIFCFWIVRMESA